MYHEWVFNETAPSSAASAVSSQAVKGNPPSGSGATDGASTLGIATGLDDFQALMISADIVGNTGGTLDVCIQTNAAGVWQDYVHFTQAAASATIKTYAVPCSTSSGDVSTATPTQVGTSATTITLAANSLVGGCWGSQMRLLMVSGTGTTAGAAVVVRIQGMRFNPWR